MNKDYRIITKRIDEGFERKSRTRYRIMIANDPYDKSYNFFLNAQHAGQRLKSTPLHTVDTYDLAYLEDLVTALQQFTKLTIEYVGFTGEVWPESNHIIQKKRMNDE